MSEKDVRLTIEGDEAIIVAILTAIKIGGTRAEWTARHDGIPQNEKLTLETVSDVSNVAVGQFQEYADEFDREQVVIEVDEPEDLVDLEIVWSDHE